MTNQDRGRRVRALARLPLPLTAAMAGVGVCALASPALAQTVLQRNLPPPPPSAPPPQITAPTPVAPDQDARPLGPALREVVVLGPGQPLATEEATAKVDTSRLPRLNNGGVRRALARFVGKPISRKLISQIQVQIVRAYRDAGYPFVALQVPPQDITHGVLQIRVIEFHAGKVTATSTDKPTADYVRSRVRLQPGQEINASDLSEDVEWLNRYPYRQVSPVFSPGSDFAATDVNLAVTATKPWRVYAGYQNNGSPSTGIDRYFIGAGVGGLFGHGSLVSYQLTASTDFWDKNSHLFADAIHPQYVSSAGRLYAPTGPRQDIEATFSAIETNVVVPSTQGNFLARQKTLELNVAYRTALSNFTPLRGDLALGIETNRQMLDTLFGGVKVRSQIYDTFQLYATYSRAWSGPSARTSYDITVEASPGGIDDHNSKAALALYSPNRPASVQYAYVTGDFTRITKLPFNLLLSNQIYGQYSPRALPPSVLFGIGSPDLVRGYTPDEGGFDEALISRNELHFQSSAIPFAGRFSAVRDHLAPFVFYDTGYGEDQVTKKHDAANSIGAGFGYQVGQWFANNVDLAYDLTRGRATPAGTWRLEYRGTVSF